jgi:hypothetical protein
MHYDRFPEDAPPPELPAIELVPVPARSRRAFDKEAIAGWLAQDVPTYDVAWLVGLVFTLATMALVGLRSCT